MIAFAKLRTKRLTIQLKEMSIGDALYLMKLPEKDHEAATTEFLSRVISQAESVGGQITDPAMMTIQERGYLVAHYLAHALDTPDFQIGDGRFSNYILDGASEPPAVVELGNFNDDNWLYRPLIGRHAESIERLISWDRIKPGLEGWLVGAMAASLTTEAAKEPDIQHLPDENLDALIQSKYELICAMPETDFHVLVSLFFHAVNSCHHLLKLSIGAEGFTFENVSGGAGLPPARFPVNTAISTETSNIFGKFN